MSGPKRTGQTLAYLEPGALALDHISSGHPEGLFEAWANLYGRFAQAMRAADAGDTAGLARLRYPDIEAGIAGVRWVETCVRSADGGGVWVDYA